MSGHRERRRGGGFWASHPTPFLLLSLFTLSILAAALGAACSAFDTVPLPPACNEIPEGGCPGVGKGSCVDLTCEAIYRCDNGAWVFESKCAAHDAGMPDVRPPPARDAHWDVPPGAIGVGCPDLQPQCGDCSLSLALACPADECCGCQTLYLCDDGGWNVWGYCLDGGAFMVSPPLVAPDK
jgi:hypothetical protein